MSKIEFIFRLIIWALPLVIIAVALFIGLRYLYKKLKKK